MLALATLAMTVSMIAPAAQAKQKEVKTPGTYLAEGWNRGLFIPYLEKIARVSNDKERDRSCDDMYANVLAKREIKIILGLGYYDSSEGGDFKFQYRDERTGKLMDGVIGMNDTIDIPYVRMYSDLFKRKCTGNLRLCGMQETSSGVFEKDVKSPDGKKIHVVLEMRNSSYTDDHQNNVSIYKDQQKAKSDATTRWFFESIPTSDVVVYNGHSRKGGGPDFNPPRLLSNQHVNYTWYQKNEPGFNYLLQALEQPTKPAVLMLMSCNSKALFEKRIHAEAPRTAFSGSKEVIPGDITTKGALGGIDSFLRFQCQDGFVKEMNITDDLVRQLDPLRIPN